MSAVLDFVEDVVDTVVDFAGDVVDAVDDALHWIDDEIIQPVVHTVEKTVEAALDDPLGTIAKVATAIYAPVWLPVTSAAVTIANGGDLGDAALSAAAAYVAPKVGNWAGAEAGKFVGASVAPELGTQFAETAANAAATVVRGGASAATASVITGRGDPLNALLIGGVSAATPLLTDEIPGFDQLPKQAQQLVNSAVAAELTGRDPTQSTVNTALNLGIQWTADYLKEEFNLGSDGATKALAAAIQKSPSSGGSAPTGGASSSGVQVADAGQLRFDESGNPILSDAGGSGVNVPAFTEEEGRRLADLSADEYQQLLDAFGGTSDATASGDTPSTSEYAETEYGKGDDALYEMGKESEWAFDAFDPMQGFEPTGPKDYSELSFGKAFTQARLGGEDVFAWNGDQYNTRTAEEEAATQNAFAPLDAAPLLSKNVAQGAGIDPLRLSDWGSQDPKTQAFLQDAAKTMGFDPSIYFPGVQLQPSQSDRGELANVPYESWGTGPTTVNVSPTLQNLVQSGKLSPAYGSNVLAHELAHVGQALSSAPGEDAAKLVNRLAQQTGMSTEDSSARGTSDLTNFNNAINQSLDYINQKYGTMTGYTSSPNSPLYEKLTDLTALEAQTGVDLTKDPVLQQTLFSDPRYASVYNAMTIPRMTRLDPRDLPTGQVLPNEMSWESQLKAKMNSLLGYASGGIADLPRRQSDDGIKTLLMKRNAR
jgi:hypothetical protein